LFRRKLLDDRPDLCTDRLGFGGGDSPDLGRESVEDRNDRRAAAKAQLAEAQMMLDEERADQWRSPHPAVVCRLSDPGGLTLARSDFL
jgi:hypothetical protein